MAEAKAGELIVVIKMGSDGKVVVEGTILNEIVTMGLIEKAKRTLEKHYDKQADSKIVKPEFIPPMGMMGRQ